MMKDINIKKTILSYTVIVLIAILLALNYQLFIVNNSFAPAGLNGIATMIQYKTGFSIGYMSIIINVPLCILAYFMLNKTFAMRSFVFCIVYSFSFLYIQRVGLEQFQYNANGHDTIYPVIISSVISGVVYGICFKENSSTGGTDIVSKYISYKKPQLNFFYVTFALNTIVAIISFFVYAETKNGELVYNYKPVCLCITYCFTSSFVGDYILKGTKSAYKFTIITNYPNEIIKDIKEKLRHSSTRVSATGAFSGEEKAVIICVINKHQMCELNEILKSYDKTFSFAETVNETFGNFKKIK
ncbi:MAG: YitT family protein [Clostridia bacterium]|nr:YitT family protein [Clostridia bacterium]